MTDRPTFPCGVCGRTFGGYRAYRDGHVGHVCLDAKALRRRGLRYHHGIWVRPDPTAASQRSLFGPGRPRNARPPVIPSATEGGGGPRTDARSAGTGTGQETASLPIFDDAASEAS